MLTRDYTDPDWRERDLPCSYCDPIPTAEFSVVSTNGHVELRKCDACGEQVPVDTRGDE